MALQELIYTSLARSSVSKDVVQSILETSERNNLASHVTGLLLFDGIRYIQILEGEPETVDHLYVTITKDNRHTALELLHRGDIEGRAFENWRMTYEALPPGLLNDLAESMAVYAMESDGDILNAEDSFGSRLNGMFMETIAAE